MSDLRTTDPEGASTYEANHGTHIARTARARAAEEGVDAGGVPFGEHAACDDPGCWACFLLPEAREQLVADIIRRAS